MQVSGRHAIDSAQRQWLISIAFVAVPLFVSVWIVVLISMNSHIRARRAAEDALREQARRDPLTGVLNHGAILDELRAFATAIERPQFCIGGRSITSSRRAKWSTTVISSSNERSLSALTGGLVMVTMATFASGVTALY